MGGPRTRGVRSGRKRCPTQVVRVQQGSPGRVSYNQGNGSFRLNGALVTGVGIETELGEAACIAITSDSGS